MAVVIVICALCGEGLSGGAEDFRDAVSLHDWDRWWARRRRAAIDAHLPHCSRQREDGAVT